jgi:hypothetical protein
MLKLIQIKALTNENIYIKIENKNLKININNNNIIKYLSNFLFCPNIL